MSQDYDTQYGVTHVLFCIGSEVMIFKKILFFFLYTYLFADLKCCSYGCGCRRECRAPDFSTGPLPGKLSQ